MAREKSRQTEIFLHFEELPASSNAKKKQIIIVNTVSGK